MCLMGIMFRSAERQYLSTSPRTCGVHSAEENKARSQGQNTPEPRETDVPAGPVALHQERLRCARLLPAFWLGTQASNVEPSRFPKGKCPTCPNRSSPASLPRPPAFCISAVPAPRCSTGSMHADVAASSCCALRIPTGRVPPPKPPLPFCRALERFVSS